MKRLFSVFFALLITGSSWLAQADSLADVKARGVLRHLGVPYANFVTGAGDGLSIELMQGFARHLGVRYEFVSTTWANAFGELTGKKVKPTGNRIEIVGEMEIRGDVISSGLTVLPWREQIVTFATPSFPTQVWLVTDVSSDLRPIHPSGNLERDIKEVKALLANRTVLGKSDTCLDPGLYDLAGANAKPLLIDGSLNDVAPAMLNRAAETAILDVPDALIALEKWVGQILIIGPISEQQQMAEAFRPEDRELREEFNIFFAELKHSGKYAQMVKRYFPGVFDYYPFFFNN